ncbi:MAG TPA: diguanylate cyclase [Solirubrobacteraceae bacterium]|nr:diguanylate cyclase [Solirubrobacteraceae bacterium]
MERAAEALLREHPDALVCALSTNGLIVPLPGSVPLWGQAAIEGRAVIDGVVAADRSEVVSLWKRLEQELAVSGKVRMLSDPSKSVTLHFLDLTGTHGVRLCVILPSSEAADEDGEGNGGLAPAAGGPRFATLLEDEGAKVIECDDAFTEMFGYTAAELIGNSVLDQIHPDDQGRAVEGWLNVLSTRRHQQTRLRRRRRDGSWVWVDTTLHNFLNQNDRNYVLVELIDVSAEMAAQEALREREELLRGLTEAMPVGLMQLDRERNVVYYNARLQQLLGTREEDVAAAGGPPQPAISPRPHESIALGVNSDSAPAPVRSLLGALTREGSAEFEAQLTRVLDEAEDADVEVDVVADDGEWRRVLMSIRSLLRADGAVGGAIVSVLDVTDSAVANRELERRATFDALTGCYNRGAILELLERELAREDGASIGVVYVDLDNFKPVNDTLGHAAGDELLASIAERLRELTRREDDVGRLGGDEFLVLLPDIRSSEVAMRVADRICASLRDAVELSAGPAELTASVGVACGTAGAIGADQLVKLADSAMYCSKQDGGATARLHDDAPLPHLQRS